MTTPRNFLLSLCLLIAGVWLVGGCSSPSPALKREEAARREINVKIAGIRDAILAKSAQGIMSPGTVDWSFTGSDGVNYDRAAYLKRTEALFARIVAIESLVTEVEGMEFGDENTAMVKIVQTMVRREREAASGKVVRLRLHYREQHVWVRTTDGWRVRSVRFLGAPERRVLPD